MLFFSILPASSGFSLFIKDGFCRSASLINNGVSDVADNSSEVSEDIELVNSFWSAVAALRIA